MRTLPVAVVRTAVALVCALSLTACGGGGDDPDAGASPDGASDGIDALRTEAAPEASADPADDAGEDADDGAQDDDACADAGDAVETALAGVAEVTSVEVIGQCTTVSIGTALGVDPAGSGAATAICEQASEAAYAHELGSVSVYSADETELAFGIEGASCLTSQ